MSLLDFAELLKTYHLWLIEHGEKDDLKGVLRFHAFAAYMARHPEETEE